MSIASLLDGVAAAIEAAGVTATTDPGVVLAQVAKHPVVAFVDAPTVEPLAQSGSAAVTIPVHVVMRPPAGQAELRPVLDVLPDLIRALSLHDDLTPETLQLGDQQLPGYQITIRTRTTC